MSNARSPREVCSTTIGTSGLIVLASVSLHRPDSSRTVRGPTPLHRLAVPGPTVAGPTLRVPAVPGLALRRPQPTRLLEHTLGGALLSILARALGPLLPRRPQLLARTRSLDRDRLGGLRDQ